MSKLLLVAIIIIIGCQWSQGMTCASCGNECVFACGTRRFRTCCFNYLRRKRVPEAVETKMPIIWDELEDSDVHNAHLIPEVLELWRRGFLKGYQRFGMSNED